MIGMLEQEIIYDKPSYVGTSVLELSKLHMMKFHDDAMHAKLEVKYNLI